MVDTVLWDAKDVDYLHEKILLGGILKRLDDDDEEDDEEEDAPADASQTRTQ